MKSLHRLGSLQPPRLLSRCIAAEHARAADRPEKRFVRVVTAAQDPERVYIFLVLPRRTEESYDGYRQYGIRFPEGSEIMYLLNPSDPRRRSKIFAFVKFFDKLEHAQQFLDGDLFMRRLSYYRREEDAEGRWDSTEGVFVWLQKKGLQIEMTLPNVGVANVTERDLAAPVSMSLGETDDLFIFCMYAYYIEEPLPGDDLSDIYGDDRLAELEAALHIDPKCLLFGPHAVVVPCGPFMERLRRAAINQSLRVRADLVRYYDNEILSGEFDPEDVPFRKQKRFEYQREYRICIRTLDRFAEPRTFDIGSLRGFGGYIPSERVLKAFKLSLAGEAA